RSSLRRRTGGGSLPDKGANVKAKKGFSYLELVVVLALIGLFLIVSTSNLIAAQRQRDFDDFFQEVITALKTCRWRALRQRKYAGIYVRQDATGKYSMA